MWIEVNSTTSKQGLSSTIRGTDDAHDAIILKMVIKLLMS